MGHMMQENLHLRKMSMQVCLHYPTSGHRGILMGPWRTNQPRPCYRPTSKRG